MSLASRLSVFKKFVFALLTFVFGGGLLSVAILTQPARAKVSPYGEAIRQRMLTLFDPHSICRIDEILSDKPKIFKIPNRNHAPGMQHSAIYRAHFNGTASLVKTNVLNGNRHVNDESFRYDLFGMLLSAEIGGPQIFRAGKFAVESGQVAYFVEMEELFAGETDTFTFKGWGSRTAVGRILAWRAPSLRQLTIIGEMINKAVERGIQIFDCDLLFSQRQDEVRWIDSTEWFVEGTRSFKQTMCGTANYSRAGFGSVLGLNNYGHLITLFFRLRREYGHAILKSVLSSVRTSEVWPANDKKQLIENWREILVEHWKLPADYFQAADSGANLR